MAQDEKQRFNKLVAVADGSRGSRLSVFEMTRRSCFMDGVLSRHTTKGFTSLLSSVAKSIIVVAYVEPLTLRFER